MPTSFILKDPAPMDRVIVKVEIGSRPPLDKGYLNDQGLQTNEIEAYRHVVSYALIARALKKCVKGLTPNQVRAWLSRDEAWLDPNTIDDYRGPLVIGGELPGTQVGVQAALGAWLANATNCFTNIHVGSADVNYHKGASINPAIDRLKPGWARLVCHIDDVGSLRCVDVQTGEKKRYRANGSFYDDVDQGGRKGFLEYYRDKDARWGRIDDGVTMTSVQGTIFEIVAPQRIDCRNLRLCGDHLFGDRGAGTERLVAAGDVKEIHGFLPEKKTWARITQEQFASCIRFRVFLESSLQRLGAIRVDHRGDVYEVSRSFKAKAELRASEQDPVQLLGAAIDPTELHDKVLKFDYIKERQGKIHEELGKVQKKQRELNKKIDAAESSLESDQPPSEATKRLKRNLGQWKKQRESQDSKKKLLEERHKRVTKILSVIDQSDLEAIYNAIQGFQMEDPRTRSADPPVTYEKRSVALLALGWKGKYLPHNIRKNLRQELAEIEQVDRHTARVIENSYRSPGASTPSDAPAAPLAGRPNASARAVKITAVGLKLAYDTNPMDQRIVKVVTGDRPDLNRDYLKKKGIKAGEEEDLRHVISYVLIAKALRVCLKGLTPNQVAFWLEKPEVWLDRERVDHYVETLRDPVGIGGAASFNTITRTVGTVQAAVDAWLKNATNYFKNLYAGSDAINRSKGATLGPAKTALKQIWRRYLCDVSGASTIHSVDKQSDKEVSFKALTPSHAGKLKGTIRTAIGRDIVEASVDASAGYDPRQVGPLGVLLRCLPGAEFRIRLATGQDHPSRAGALLIDKNYRIFQVSREFSLIERVDDRHHGLRKLDFPASNSAGEPGQQDLSRRFLKTAIDPKHIQQTPLDKMTTTRTSG